MPHVQIKMPHRKRLAIVAHDHKKQELLDWARWNVTSLREHEIYATGTTGRMLLTLLGLRFRPLLSGPLGGDQQIGAKIAEGEIDLLVFFWDPLQSLPHDPDVKALLRLAVVWNIPIACNRSSADFMVSSPLMAGSYERMLPDYSSYVDRELKAC